MDRHYLMTLYRLQVLFRVELHEKMIMLREHERMMTMMKMVIIVVITEMNV